MNDRRIFGWDLPPGVTTAMIERAYGGDEPVQPRCEQCRGFLPFEPERTEPWEDGFDCNGVAEALVHPYAADVIAIIGEEYRGQTYTEFRAPCGRDDNHPPHREIMWAGFFEYRTCRRCGHVNKESIA